MLPYSGDSFVTYVGLFFLLVLIFVLLKKNILKEYEEELWEQIVSKNRNQSLFYEARMLTFYKAKSVDYRWSNAKSRLRGTLSKCLSGYNCGFAFVALSICASVVFLFMIFLLAASFYYSITKGIRTADSMLIVGQFVLFALISIEAYCYYIRKDLESPLEVVFYSFLITTIAIIIGILWTWCDAYPKIICPDIAYWVYVSYAYIFLLPFVLYALHVCYVYSNLKCRLSHLRLAIKHFKEADRTASR